jgi:hypothetical protein
MSNAYKDWLRDQAIEDKLKEKIVEKAIGAQVLVEVIVKQLDSGIVLPEAVQAKQDVTATIKDLGTSVPEELGLAVGQEIVVRANTSVVELPSGLKVIPASAIIAVLNYGA